MRRLTVAASAAVGLWAMASPVRAHGIGGRLDLPVPVSYFAVGAGLVVALSFGLLAVLWPRPRLQDGPRYRRVRLPGMRGRAERADARPGRAVSLGHPVERGDLSVRPLRLARGLARVLGVVALVLVVAAGLVQLSSGSGSGPTVAPVLVWVVFWLVIPFVSVLLGNLYAAVNPWRTLAGWLEIGRNERPDRAEALGVWPAVGVFLAFAWMELIWPESGSASTLGVAAIVYSLGLLAAMPVLGRDTALRSFDMFTTYNRMFSAVAPGGRQDGKPARRGWLRALPVLPEWPGLWAFVVVAIGTVSYDGLSVTSWWPASGMLGESLGMLGVVAGVGLAYLGACWAATRLGGGGWSTRQVAQRFAHTLVPIGIAYAVAHYLTLIFFEGQQLIAAVSDPFGVGWDLFGTADRRIDFFIRSPEPVWYAQVGLIVSGHVLGVVLAHDRALHDFSGRAAVRSQYAMLALMVLLTGFGLLLLAG